MTDLPIIDDYEALFVDNTPLLDTRALVEFSRGAFPNTQHAPLITDNEREQVGTCYKNSGKDDALALGYQLVSGQIKQQRLNAWMVFFNANPNGALYCFRGGLRSQITQQWLFEYSGTAYPRIRGGYKQCAAILSMNWKDLVKNLILLLLVDKQALVKRYY